VFDLVIFDRSNEIFFTKREKMKNLLFLRGSFPIPELADPTRPGSKHFDPDQSQKNQTYAKNA